MVVGDLPIAEVEAGGGRIGMSPCPGKRSARHPSPFDRDLARDLDRIRRWGADYLVTALDPSELSSLGVQRVGEVAAACGVQWFHIPIVDGRAPGPEAERRWRVVSPRLTAALAGGASILIHCRAGIGRTGTLAARLMVDAGWEPSAAIEAVRRARPGAIETGAQQAYVLGLAM